MQGAAAGLPLTACTGTVDAQVTAATRSAGSAGDDVTRAAVTAPAHRTPSSHTGGATTRGADTADNAADDPSTDQSGGAGEGSDLPGPGDGNGVYPDDVVPLLDQLAAAPYDHLDANKVLWDQADELSTQTGDIIDEIVAGADAADSVSELDQPMSLFGDSCIRAGVAV